MSWGYCEGCRHIFKFPPQVYGRATDWAGDGDTSTMPVVLVDEGCPKASLKGLYVARQCHMTCNLCETEKNDCYMLLGGFPNNLECLHKMRSPLWKAFIRNSRYWALPSAWDRLMAPGEPWECQV